MAKQKVETENTKVAPEVVEKALAATNEQGLSTDVNSAWGGENIAAEDCIIPKILLMQATSHFVKDLDVARSGQFVDSLEPSRVLGDGKNPVEVIIFGSFKNWVIKLNGKYQKTLPWTPENDAMEYEEDTADGIVNRFKIINYYCILPEDVKKGEVFPFVMSFKSTGFRTGKQIGTWIQKLASFNKPSAAKVFAIGHEKEVKENNSYLVPNAKAVRDTTKEELAIAFNWYKRIQSVDNNFKVDDSDEKADEPTVSVQKGPKLDAEEEKPNF